MWKRCYSHYLNPFIFGSLSTVSSFKYILNLHGAIWFFRHLSSEYVTCERLIIIITIIINNHRCQWKLYLLYNQNDTINLLSTTSFQCGVSNGFQWFFFPHFIHFTKIFCKKYSLESVENFDAVSKVTEKLAGHLSPAKFFSLSIFCT